MAQIRFSGPSESDAPLSMSERFLFILVMFNLMFVAISLLALPRVKRKLPLMCLYLVSSIKSIESVKSHAVSFHVHVSSKLIFVHA